jgi:spore coat polysaccharide biosynthesis protein SpsF
MKTTAIVQARMGSTRLPGKVLMDLGGETVLGRVVRRLSRAARVQEVVIATPSCTNDDAITIECQRLGVACFRGPEHDVLARYVGAAERFGCELIVRITSDCPLIDPEIVDEVIQSRIEKRADLACNDLPATFPRGLDVEVFTLEALRKVQALATENYQREHVTPVFYERQDNFRIASVQAERDYSLYRWTVDTAEDLHLIREIYAQFANDDHFGWRAVLELVQHRPELARINAHIAQKPLRDLIADQHSSPLRPV